MKKTLQSYFAKNEKIETIVFWTSLSLIFIPIRIVVFYSLMDNWYGLIGGLFCTISTITILAKKKKLGWFGKIYLKQISKIHKGKKQYLIFGVMSGIILFASTSLYLINEGNTTYLEEKKQVYDYATSFGVNLEDKIGVVSINEKISINAGFMHDIQLIDVIKALSVSVAILDTAFNGWISFFWTTILVTETEMFGVLAITKIISNKTKK